MHDFGRERVTGLEEDRFKFRTPSLHNVADSGPWMHDGAFTTLEAAVRHELDPVTSANSCNVAQLTNDMANLHQADQTSELVAAADAGEITPVVLTAAEIDDLVSFLHSLSSPKIKDLPQRDIPTSVPSGLPVAD